MTRDEQGREHGGLLYKHSIYESVAQFMDHVDVKKIRLQRDRVLVEDIPDSDRIGSIWVPESAKGLEQIRQGIVVAIGPGDDRIDRLVSQNTVDAFGHARTAFRSAETVSGHLPMSVRPGDRVLYGRRDDSEIYVGGKTLCLCYEEQSILGRLTAGPCPAKREHRRPKWDHADCQQCGGVPSPPPIYPLRDRVLISRDAKPQKTPGGIHIPANTAEERPEGIVVACGPGKLRSDGTWAGMDVRPLDHVVFREGAGTSIQISGERFLIMREDEVAGVLE